MLIFFFYSQYFSVISSISDEVSLLEDESEDNDDVQEAIFSSFSGDISIPR